MKDATKENILNYMNYRLHREAAHTLPNGSPREGNIVAETNIDESGVSQFLGEQTTKDIVGEEGYMDEEGEAKVALRLTDIMTSCSANGRRLQAKSGWTCNQMGCKDVC